MANTWNKIKNKFKWKKGGSRSRNHRKSKKTRAHRQNSASNLNPSLSLPRSRRHEAKCKKPTKSNIFGCFSAVPKEYTHRNVQRSLQSPSPANPVPNHLSSPPPSPSSKCRSRSRSSSSSKSIQNSVKRTPSSKLTQISIPPITLASPDPFAPLSPSKSNTTLCFNPQSVTSVCSEVASIKYNMTPTPCTDCTLTDDYDIYEGVLEVEDDSIIQVDDIDSYYDERDDTQSQDDDMDQQRDSIIIKSPERTVIASVDRDSHEHHSVMDDEYFMHLNAELLRNGYNNPHEVLHEPWMQHIDVDRGDEISNIWQFLCEKKKQEIADQEMKAMEAMDDDLEDEDEDEDDDIKVDPATPPTIESHKSSTASASQSMVSGSDKRLKSGSTLSEELDYYDGDVFHDKYVVGAKINEGGFGSVWKIIDNNLYSKCVKIMELGRNEESQIRRRKACIREYNMTRKAFSDEIVEVSLFMDNVRMIANPKAYLIMPYFEGRDLFEFIDDDDYFRKVSVHNMLHIFYKISEKLYDLHYFKKIVHGDLKPENVMILQSDVSDDIEVEIIDYGIAKSIRNLSSDSKYLQSKGHFGTKGYVAPELMRESKYNRKIDVFSAGVVLYNMVTECCLFPKGHKYYRLCEAEYYKYLKKKFKCIKKQKMVLNILYSCLAYDPDERLDVKQLIQKYFHSKR